MKINKKTVLIMCLVLAGIWLSCTTIEGTWSDASGQIKTVVNKEVFPAIDIILAVFFFAKLGMAYFDCAPVTAM